MNKDIDYYMELNYPIEITKIPEDEGGGYTATIPQLGRKVFVSDGETIDEATRNLEDIKREWFQTYIDRGIPIPEPKREEEEEYSGKFITRIPKELHRTLVKGANQNGVSLNQHVLYLLSSGAACNVLEKAIEVCSNRFEKMINRMQDFEIKYEQSQQKARNLQLIYSKSDYERAA